MKQTIYIYVIFALIACNKPHEPTNINKEQIIEDIEQMLSHYHTDINKDGLTAEFKYLDQSSDFFWVPPGYTAALNYDSVSTILKQNAQSLSTVEFQWDTLQIFPLSNNIANYTGIVKGKMTDTAGTESNVSIIESGTLIKRDNGWKLLNGQPAILDLKTKE